MDFTYKLDLKAISQDTHRSLHNRMRLASHFTEVRSVQYIFKANVEVSSSEDVMLQVGTREEWQPSNLKYLEYMI